MMATVNFDGMDGYLQMLAKLGDKQDEVFRKMVNAGARVAHGKLKAANATFAKHVKLKLGKKNQYGWFAQVQFRGKTESGAPAALAANVYEHGKAGQPARPFIKAASAAAESEAIEAMQKVYDEEVAKIGS